MKSTAKFILFLLAALLLSGCFVVVRNGEETKVFGNSKEHALDTLQRVDDTQQEAKRQLWPRK